MRRQSYNKQLVHNKFMICIFYTVFMRHSSVAMPTAGKTGGRTWISHQRVPLITTSQVLALNKTDKFLCHTFYWTNSKDPRARVLLLISQIMIKYRLQASVPRDQRLFALGGKKINCNFFLWCSSHLPLWKWYEKTVILTFLHFSLFLNGHEKALKVWTTELLFPVLQHQ